MIEPDRHARLHPALWLGLPLLLLAGYVASMFLQTSSVLWLYTEDGPAEWAQFVMFLMAGLLGLHLARRATAAPRWMRAFYLCFGLAGLLVAGEEISWGQHLLQYKTPEALAVANKQNEANLHNLWNDRPARLMRRLLEFGLPLLCIAVPAMLLILRRGYERPQWPYYLLPRLEMVPSLLVAAMGRPFRKSRHWGWPANWNLGSSEFAELLWAMALLIWIAVLYLRLRGDQAVSRSR